MVIKKIAFVIVGLASMTFACADDVTWEIHNNFDHTINEEATTDLNINPQHFDLLPQQWQTLGIEALTERNELSLFQSAGQDYRGNWAFHFENGGATVTLRVIGDCLATTWSNAQKAIFLCSSTYFDQHQNSCRPIPNAGDISYKGSDETCPSVSGSSQN